MSACLTGCGEERLRGSLFCGTCGDGYDRSMEYAEYLKNGMHADDWYRQGMDSIEAFSARVRATREMTRTKMETP